jgi:hypothetical protein
MTSLTSTSRGALLAAALACGAAPATAAPILGLLSDNSLIRFDSATPGAATAAVAVQGLAVGEGVRGIDFRPRDKMVYGLVSLANGTGARLVTIDPITGATTNVAPLLDGAGGVLVPTATPVTLRGQSFGVDFNPQVDLFRIVSDAEQNLAANPGGRVLGGAAGTTRIDSDLNIGMGPAPGLNVIGAAYTNNRDGTTSTVLYTLDSITDQLAIQSPPNAGTQTMRMSIGQNAVGDVGFDIFGMFDTAFASFIRDDLGNLAELFRIDLMTGDATPIGFIGGQLGGVRVADITVLTVPEPATLALLGAGMLAIGAYGRRRATA